MQSSQPALYPATDSEYRIQWGTYGDSGKLEDSDRTWDGKQ
ncbi:hypothetical protein ACQFX9_10730 [Aliinostoc sp. HNIBRCY26]